MYMQKVHANATFMCNMYMQKVHANVTFMCNKYMQKVHVMCRGQMYKQVGLSHVAI